MFDVKELNAEQLATCVDEYVKRTIDRLNAYCGDDRITTSIMIHAYTYTNAEQYDIEHKIDFGDYKKEIKYVGGNCIAGADYVLDQHLRSKQHTVTQVTKQLPPPPPPAPSEDYAEFTPVDF